MRCPGPTISPAMSSRFFQVPLFQQRLHGAGLHRKLPEGEGRVE